MLSLVSEAKSESVICEDSKLDTPMTIGSQCTDDATSNLNSSSIDIKQDVPPENNLITVAEPMSSTSIPSTVSCITLETPSENIPSSQQLVSLNNNPTVTSGDEISTASSILSFCTSLSTLPFTSTSYGSSATPAPKIMHFLLPNPAPNSSTLSSNVLSSNNIAAVSSNHIASPSLQSLVAVTTASAVTSPLLTGSLVFTSPLNMPAASPLPKFTSSSPVFNFQKSATFIHSKERECQTTCSAAVPVVTEMCSLPSSPVISLVYAQLPPPPPLLNMISNRAETDPTSPDFDPIQALKWKDDVGTLPGSSLKFKLTEFGTLEVITEDHKEENDKSAEEKSPIVAESTCGTPGGYLSYDVHDNACGFTNRTPPSVDSAGVDKEDDNRKCENCGCCRPFSQFYGSGRFCSQACVAIYANKKNSEALLWKKRRKLLKYQSKRLKEERILNQGEVHIKNKGLLHSPIADDSSELKFSWPEYLEREQSIAAPPKMFHSFQTFPGVENEFEYGMKLEGIDPKHPSMFCVLSVTEICGYRMRLHFDGYSDCYDFWTNADSSDIFPAGWSQRNGKMLCPPKGIPSHIFNWDDYLKVKNAKAASEHLFKHVKSEPTCKHGFCPGMKLEAVMKKMSLTCVATVSCDLENRFLVHFDGWEDTYDFWADPSSLYIHPMYWCRDNGVVLTPPKNFKNDNFDWEDYLSSTKSQPVPAHCFKTRSPNKFVIGMKLEAVDKRNPMLIRVSTVVEKHAHYIKIHFDGWASAYDLWYDDDSPDIHPAGWCSKTGHPLQSPVDISNLSEMLSSCPTPGCSGFGHIKGPKYTTHHSTFGCPYSDINISKDTAVQDRLGKGEGNAKTFDAYNENNGYPLVLRNSFPSYSNASVLQSKKLPKSDNSNSAELSLEGSNSSKEDYKGKLIGTRSSIINNMQDNMGVKHFSNESSHSNSKGRSFSPQKNIKGMISTMKGTHGCAQEMPLFWERNCRNLSRISKFRGTDVAKWSADKVADFIASIPGCKDHAKIFEEEQIDGEAFLLMTQTDIVKLLKIKLGPALKIYNSILIFCKTLYDKK